MRLICPNCGAQYEVPNDVIPAGGRDVQCSSCGHTWLETPGASVAAELEMPSDDSVSVSKAVRDASAKVTPEQIVEPETDSNFTGSIGDAFADIDPSDPPANLPDTTTDFESAEGEETPTTAPRRRPVDASVSEILKEEAALEVAARRTEMGAALEQQDDLGLSDAPSAPRSAVKQPAEKQPTDTERLMRDMQQEPKDEPVAPNDSEQAAAAATVTSAGSRKELLPDIEEINSSLRSNAERGDQMIPDPEETEQEKRRGFRFGFIAVLLTIAALVALYVFAPQISDAVPSLADAMDNYVVAVDTARIWLDIKVQALLELIRPIPNAAPA